MALLADDSRHSRPGFGDGQTEAGKAMLINEKAAALLHKKNPRRALSCQNANAFALALGLGTRIGS